MAHTVEDFETSLDLPLAEEVRSWIFQLQYATAFFGVSRQTYCTVGRFAHASAGTTLPSWGSSVTSESTLTSVQFVSLEATGGAALGALGALGPTT